MGALQTTGMARDSDGRLEIFVPCVNSGDSVQLWQLYQTAPAGGWSGWVPHGAPSSGTEPYVGFGPMAILDGHELDVIMGFGSSSPRGPWQISQTPTGWTQTWSPLGVPPGTTDVNNYALAARHYGDLELFVVSVTDPPAQTDQLWRLGQFTGSGDWNQWSSLGCPPPGGPLAPVVAASADGRLEVFTVAADGALWHIWETTLNGTWSQWTSHGSPAQSLGFTSVPVIAANSEGRLELLLTGNDFQLWHIYQTAPSGGWSDWISHGSPPGTDINGFTPAMAASADGRLELFATGFDQRLWHINQLTPSGGWCDWYSHPRPVESSTAQVGAGGTPTVTLNSAGRLELFVQGTNNELWHMWQTAPGGGWAPWLSHGKPPGFNVFPPWF
jgi:hypothetical protein